MHEKITEITENSETKLEQKLQNIQNITKTSLKDIFFIKNMNSHNLSEKLSKKLILGFHASLQIPIFTNLFLEFGPLSLSTTQLAQLFASTIKNTIGMTTFDYTSSISSILSLILLIPFFKRKIVNKIATRIDKHGSPTISFSRVFQKKKLKTLLPTENTFYTEEFDKFQNNPETQLDFVRTEAPRVVEKLKSPLTQAREQITTEIDECNTKISELENSNFSYSDEQKTERIQKLEKNIKDLKSEREKLDETATTLNKALQKIQNEAENEMTELETARKTAKFEESLQTMINSQHELIIESQIFRKFVETFATPIANAARTLEKAQSKLKADKIIRNEINTPTFTS